MPARQNEDEIRFLTIVDGKIGIIDHPNQAGHFIATYISVFIKCLTKAYVGLKLYA